MKLSDFTSAKIFRDEARPPWEVCRLAEKIVAAWIEKLSDDYLVQNGIATHQTATVEIGAILKAPCIIGINGLIASHAYLRGGVWLDENVIIGPGAEVKSSFICANSKAAHFNFIGDSIIGENVNIEAGAILANFRNEWETKEIICFDGETFIQTGQKKFGSLIGDQSCIGANAALAPGTILKKGSIVQRLASIDQIPAAMRAMRE